MDIKGAGAAVDVPATRVHGVRAMKHLCVLLCFVFLGFGCSADGDKAQWDAFWQDLRGENMQMKGNFSAADSLDNHPTQTKGRD